MQEICVGKKVTLKRNTFLTLFTFFFFMYLTDCVKLISIVSIVVYFKNPQRKIN